MLSKALALSVLNEALSTGGDYAEIYVEENHSTSLVSENGKIESVSCPVTYGAGIRILKGLRCTYGYTCDLTKKGLLSLANKLSKSFEGERVIEVKSIKRQSVKKINPISEPLDEVKIDDKIAYLKKGYDAASSYDECIVRVRIGWSDYKKRIEIYSAEGEEGKFYANSEERGRLSLLCVAKESEKIESAYDGPGAFAGWEYFAKNIDIQKQARETASKAVALLTAKECPSGRYTVVIGNGWGGVVFHEACGHSLEATATAKGLSVFSNSIGKQIASPIVSAYDDGTMPNEWGSNNIDSEGHVTQKNQLIKDGVCVGFLVDKFNGRRLHMEPNGCSRRQSYAFAPTSRMSNTYIAPGKDDPEDIIKDTPLGIYVKSFGGGSVEPATGEFNFSASEAYIIRDGKVCEPVKGCTLIGSGKEVLMNIDRVGNDLALGQGMCGSVSGLVPVNVGQPTIRIKEITVGGRGGKLE